MKPGFRGAGIASIGQFTITGDVLFLVTSLISYFNAMTEGGGCTGEGINVLRKIVLMKPILMEGEVLWYGGRSTSMAGVL